MSDTTWPLTTEQVPWCRAVDAPLQPTRCVLALIDWQDRNLRALPDSQRLKLVQDMTDLLWLAERLDVPVLLTELSDRRWGRTTAQLAGRRAAKRTTLSAWQALAPSFAASGRDVLLPVGMCTEQAVCSTVVDALQAGAQVWALSDVMASPKPQEHEAGLKRMAFHGAGPLTLSGLFASWCPDVRSPLHSELTRRRP